MLKANRNKDTTQLTTGVALDVPSDASQLIASFRAGLTE